MNNVLLNNKISAGLIFFLRGYFSNVYTFNQLEYFGL